MILRVRHILGHTVFDYRAGPPECGMRLAIVPGTFRTVADAYAAVQDRRCNVRITPADRHAYTAGHAPNRPMSKARMRMWGIPV